MFGHVLICTVANDEPLEQFSQVLFGHLGVTHVEERESSNYVEGFYFRGIAFGIDGNLAYADERGLSGYRFWLSVRPTQRGGRSGDYLHEHAHSLALFFSSFGWRTFVPDDFSTVASENEGTVYLPQSHADGNA
jgi:hypothetical protein